ncbi:MAG: GerMN domain-containing protein [Treponemataceae bacterium]
MSNVLLRLRVFFAHTARRRLFYIALLLLIALTDYAVCARTARAYEFMSVKDGKPIVERRFLPRTFSKETAIERYVSEYLLGPVSVDSSYLFAKGVSVRTVIVRGGVASVDLSADAAFPLEPGLDVRRSLAILIAGIERNFPSLKRVKVYIEGHEPYAESLSERHSNESVSKKGKSVDK